MLFTVNNMESKQRCNVVYSKQHGRHNATVHHQGEIKHSRGLQMLTLTTEDRTMV